MSNVSSSSRFEAAVEALAGLPGVGKRTAMRLALFIMKQDEDWVKNFGESVIRMRTEMRFCTVCHNMSDSDLCNVCLDSRRDAELLCVVEDIRDVMAIEATGQFRGVYHVLGGRISPMEGIGPAELTINSLLDRMKSGSFRELIFALSPTPEGDTTAFFLYRKLEAFQIPVSTLARGIGMGEELQYADELTLARSIVQRHPFEQQTGSAIR
jgi:recombination protein RecR